MVLSWKFYSGENFVPGPVFSEKIVEVWNNVFRKSGPVLKILFQVRFFIFLVSDCAIRDLFSLMVASYMA